MLNDQQKMLFAIIRRVLWNEELAIISTHWDEVENLARHQGVLWMLYPGIKSGHICVPTELLKEWRSIMHSGVYYNERLNAFQNELVAWLDSKGIRSVILKGTSNSRYYPSPDVRPLGDIDILIDRENISCVSEHLLSLGFCASKVEHGFHVGYNLKDITVELHYKCSELPESKGTYAVRTAEKQFLEYRRNVSYEGVKFPALRDTYQALMLLLHMERHMSEDGIGLRQLCDWTMFVYRSDRAHWQETLPLLKECGLFIYAKVITKVCIKYLGLPQEYAAWAADASDDIVDEFLQDVFRGGNMGKADEQKVGSLFTSRSIMGTAHQSPVRGMFAKMTHLSYCKWPISKRLKVLLPFCYLYIAINYVIQSVTNRRSKRNIFAAIGSSTKRQQLYQRLHLYEVE